MARAEVIYHLVTDGAGEIVREVPPFHDATLGDHKAMFAVLERYLRALDLVAVKRVVFCGDGAPWIWTDVEALIERLGLEAAGTHQVLDYTHAKQNLHQILAWLPKRLRPPKVERHWKALLWRGDIAGLGQAIAQTFLSQRGQKESAGEVAELLCWECPPDAIRGLSAARVALWQRQCGKCDSPGDQSALEGAGDVLDSRNGGMLFILALPVIIGPVGDNAGEPHRGNGQTGSL